MAEAQPQLLQDLALRLVDSRALSIYAVRENRERLTGKSAAGRTVIARDLATIEARDNLAQAITLRLLTPKGELAANVWTVFGYLESLFPARSVVDPANANNIVSDLLSPPQRDAIRKAAAFTRAARAWTDIVS